MVNIRGRWLRPVVFLLAASLALAGSAVPVRAAPVVGAVFLFEHFDGVTPPNAPAGWDVTDVSGTANWYTREGTRYPSGYPAHSAPNLVYFNSWSASVGSASRLFYHVGLDLSASRDVRLSFWMFHDGQYSNADYIKVQVSVDGGTTWNDVGAPFYRYTPSFYGWTEHQVDLSDYAGDSRFTNVRVGFLAVSAYGNDMHLDGIAVYEVRQAVYLPLALNAGE